MQNGMTNQNWLAPGLYSFTLQPSTYDDIFSPYYSKSGGVATATTDTHTLLRYVTVYMCKIGYMFVLYGSTSTRNKSASGVYARMMTYMCSFARHVYITSFFVIRIPFHQLLGTMADTVKLSSSLAYHIAATSAYALFL